MVLETFIKCRHLSLQSHYLAAQLVILYIQSVILLEQTNTAQEMNTHINEIKAIYLKPPLCESCFADETTGTVPSFSSSFFVRKTPSPNSNFDGLVRTKMIY